MLIVARGNVRYRVRCCHLGICDKLPDYAGVRQMIQEASETGFLKDGHVIMLSLIGYKLNKQTNQKSTSTLINRSLDRRYFFMRICLLLWKLQPYANRENRKLSHSRVDHFWFYGFLVLRNHCFKNKNFNGLASILDFNNLHQSFLMDL